MKSVYEEVMDQIAGIRAEGREPHHINFDYETYQRARMEVDFPHPYVISSSLIESTYCGLPFTVWGANRPVWEGVTVV